MCAKFPPPGEGLWDVDILEIRMQVSLQAIVQLPQKGTILPGLGPCWRHERARNVQQAAGAEGAGGQVGTRLSRALKAALRHLNFITLNQVNWGSG